MWRSGPLLALVGCYAPSTPMGVLCGPDNACPEQQQCGPDGRCTAPSTVFDALIDTTADSNGDASPLDTDGDGVPDALDNCPTVANAGQENEDGDRFGDACDPCPYDANDSPTDEDHDGVADPCDPNPTTPGDRIVVFEGFHRGIPPDWTSSGTWARDGDDVVGSGTNIYLEMPGTPATPRATASIGLSLDLAPIAAGADVQLSMPFDASTGNAIDCNLFEKADGTRSQNLFDDFSTGELAGQPLAWTTNMPYVITLVRTKDNDRCITLSNGSTISLIGSPPEVATAATVAVGAFGVTVRVSWMMVVASP